MTALAHGSHDKDDDHQTAEEVEASQDDTTADEDGNELDETDETNESDETEDTQLNENNENDTKADNHTSDDDEKTQTNDDDKATNDENNQDETTSEAAENENNDADEVDDVSETKERAPPVTVDIRVEGKDETVVSPTEVTVESFELMEYIDNDNNGDSLYPDSPRAIHAIIQALDDETQLDLTDDDVFGLGYGGNYISEIDGDGEFTSGGNSGWMYYIDNEYVPVGVLEKEIEDGDSIVLYYVTDYMDNTFSWFESEDYQVEAGEPLELELTGVNFNVVDPVEGASILVDHEAYTLDGEEVLTDADGKADVTFDEPGTYYLSAERINDNGDPNVIRPYATVSVSEKADTTPPVITVDGISDQEETDQDNVVFTVQAEDDVDGDVTPTVKVNDDVIDAVDNEYHAELQEGDNTIVVTAEDKAGNAATETYDVTFEPESEDDQEEYNIGERIDKTASYILSNKVTSEWQAIGLARAGKDVPSSYDDVFYQNVETQVEEMMDWGRTKITDIERLSIAAVAIDKDPTDVNGTDLIDSIYNSMMRGKTDSMLIQGNNGPIFALIALDTLDFPEPEDSKWNRDKLIEELINNQNDDGSWALNPSFPDPSIDITAMAIIGLSPYKDQPEVKESIEGAIEYLSSVQNDKGGFTESFVGGTSSEATSQTIIGLTAYGMDPTDEMFTKNGNNLIDHLITYHNADGGFSHLLDYGSNGMATEQAMQALVAYDLFLKDEGRLYDFSSMEGPVVDKEYLEEKIKEAENIDTDSKTEESVLVLEDAIEQAESVLNDEEATEDDVSEAIQGLTDAIDNLENEPTPEVDKSKLSEVIEAASQVDVTNKTPESADVLEAALSAANSAMATGDASQTDVDNAAKDLEEAIENLEDKANKEELVSKVEEAQSIDVKDQTKDSVETLEEAIEEAQSLLEDDNATQGEVDDALQSIDKAIKNLETIDNSETIIDPEQETPVHANETVTVEDKENVVSITLPENLPDGATIRVDFIEQEDAEEGGMIAAGTFVDVHLNLPEGDTDVREYKLTLQVNDDLADETTGIYYFNEENGEWEYVGGDMNDDGTITAIVNHFSKYGVFVRNDEEIEKPEKPEEPVNKDDLEDIIDKAKDEDISGKTDESTKVLIEAIEHAESVLNDDDATEADVTDALEHIQAALDALEDEPKSKPDSDSGEDPPSKGDGDTPNGDGSHPGESGNNGNSGDFVETVDNENEDSDETLPATATAYYTLMLFGGVLLALAVILIFIQRRRTTKQN